MAMLWLSFWGFVLLESWALCYKPVIIMHGILDKASDLQDLAGFITAAHPGTNITIIDLFDELECFTPLLKQTEVISKQIRPLMKEAEHGVHMIGFSQVIACAASELLSMNQQQNPCSKLPAAYQPIRIVFKFRIIACGLWFVSLLSRQTIQEKSPDVTQASITNYFVYLQCYGVIQSHGNFFVWIAFILMPDCMSINLQYDIAVIRYDTKSGITVRSIIEMMSDHNVDTFVSLAGPHMGQFGVSNYLKPFLPRTAKENMYKYFYNEIAQKTFSLANYWNDPSHRNLNLKYNVFLPVVNNNRSSNFYNETAVKIHKENFLRIKKLVLIGGPDDGVITPWQSSHFGFYDENQEVVEMKDQEVYLEDSFGLQTLDKRNAIHVYNISNVKHTDWHKKEEVFKMAIEPWLT